MDLKFVYNKIVQIETHYKIYGISIFENCEFQDCEEIMAHLFKPLKVGFCRKILNEEECPCYLSYRTIYNNFSNFSSVPYYQNIVQNSHRIFRINNAIFIQGYIKLCHHYYTTFCQYFDEANNLNYDCINLIFDSEGGSMRTTYYIIEYIRKNRKKKLIGYIWDCCSSAATSLFLECDNRWMRKNSKFLIHHPTGLDNKKDGNIFAKLYCLLGYKSKLKLDLQTLEKWCDESEYHTAEEGLQIGFCHHLF